MNQCYDVYKYISNVEWENIFIKGDKIGRAANIRFYNSFGIIGLIELDKYHNEFDLMGKSVSIKYSKIREIRGEKTILKGSEIYIWEE